MGAPDIKDSRPYEFIPGDGYCTLRLSGQLESSSVAPANAQYGEFIKEPYPYLLVNCEALTYMAPDWIRFLLRVMAELKKYNRHALFIGIQPNLRQVLKRDGLDNAFKEVPGHHDALVSWGLATKKRLDTDFINPFLEATIKVLKVQTKTEATPGKIFVKKGNERFSGDVSGIIGIVSEAFNGSVVISFPEKTFLAIMSGMLGEQYDTLTPDIIDGAGEITNMVFGQAKVVLNAKGYGIKTALPSVISGKDHSLQALTKGPCVVIPFQSSAGEFFVEICLSN